ncbi:MAG TPA: nuclear transport factor 2 family protein [Rariglobus sp.]
MRTSRCLFLALVCLVLNVLVPVMARAAGQEREADHVALRALRDRLTTALNQRDVKTMAGCFAKEFAFTTVNQTVLTNEAQIQAFFDDMFRGDSALLTSLTTQPEADIPTRFVDANTGVCYGTTIDTYTMKSGEVVAMKVRWSTTVVKEDGQWKVALAHAGTDLLHNPVLDRVTAASRRLAIIAGIGGLLLGLAAGWVLGRAKKA